MTVTKHDYCFKFVDHDKPSCDVINVCVYERQHKHTWNPKDRSSMMKWHMREHEKSHKIYEKIMEIPVLKKLVNEYSLKKKMKEDKCEFINVNFPSKSVELMTTCDVKKCSLKYVRGTDRATHEGDEYHHTYKEFIFELLEQGNDIHFNEKCTCSITEGESKHGNEFSHEQERQFMGQQSVNYGNKGRQYAQEGMNQMRDLAQRGQNWAEQGMGRMNQNPNMEGGSRVRDDYEYLYNKYSTNHKYNAL